MTYATTQFPDPSLEATLTGSRPPSREALRRSTRGDRHRHGHGDEGSLIERLRQRDEASYELLVRRYGPRMLAVARRFLHHEQDAQDALQEAFLSAFRSIDRFDGRSSLATWLHRIAVNAALMKLRAAKRRRELALEELSPATDGGRRQPNLADTRSISAETRLLRAECKRLVRDCIASLPARHRVVLLLREVEELDTAETAGLLGITENAVKIRLHRARHALASALRVRLPAMGLFETAIG